MTTVQLEIALLIPYAILTAPFLIHLFRRTDMADFTALTAATDKLTATTARVEALISSLNDPATQASVDAATAAVTASDTTLTALAPVVEPPVA